MDISNNVLINFYKAAYSATVGKQGSVSKNISFATSFSALPAVMVSVVASGTTTSGHFCCILSLSYSGFTTEIKNNSGSSSVSLIRASSISIGY